MYLKEIPRKASLSKVILMQSTSDSLKLFVQDNVKASLKCTADHVIRVDNKKDLKEAQTLSVLQPFGADKWLFLTDLDKVPLADFIKVALQSTTGLFLCTTNKYFNYKKVKEIFTKSKADGLEELYLNYLKRVDLLTLYDNYVLESNRLSDSLYTYVVKTYSSDVEALFLLLEALKDGDVFDDKRKIIDLCGRGKNTTDNLMIGVLTSEPKSDKGINTVVRNKIQLGLDLSEELSWDKMWAFSKSFVKNLCEVKELVIAGAVYNSLFDLPDGYDPKRLTRMNRYLWFVKGQPMSKILRLLALLESRRWDSELDYMGFIYEYYKLDTISRLVVK